MGINAVTSGNLCYTNSVKKLNDVNVATAEKTSSTNLLEIYDSFTRDVKVDKGQRVSFKEGAMLVGKGFVNKIKSMGKAIIEHPIKTLGAVVATTAGLAALPLIGITTATGAAVMAIGFAGYAIGKTAVDVTKAVKHNKEGEYNEVRKDLEKIGGDGLDLALSLPFLPKAINQVTRFARYGTSTVGINSELIAGLKNIKNVKDIPLEFAKAETLINYEMIGNEMGLAVKPRLVFKDMPVSQQGTIAGAFEPTSGELQINQNVLAGQGKTIARLSGMDNPEILIRHELEHFRQFADIARTENIGINGLANTITEYYQGATQKLPISELEKQGLSRQTIENMLHGDKSAMNTKLYQDVIDANGIIKAGTPEAEMAVKYAQGLLEKINPSPESIAQFEEAVSGISPFCISASDRIKIAKAQLELYKSNTLEKEAYAVQDVFKNTTIKHRPGMGVSTIETVSVVAE